MSHTARCNNVMIVEDDRDIRDSIQDALECEGYRVVTAVHGQDALDMLLGSPKTWRPCFILLDLMMPVMNGWEFLLRLKSTPEIADIPVMVCSAVAERSAFPGVVDYVKKPINLDELLDAVARYCDPARGAVHGDHQSG